ncbi:hypothetical protein AJ78_02686 [Emergomyces pasteurianus Ep9510]|uniref:Uncharacterized protein n=1 Tax=Emergomyces pasteurianus Ep9510 TaxID=1447872 RepID=A0A1J9PL81_9EURO|nr:hypothetical protein AJ78_02686 [Emergomyces pasteurianus Ep9510]
MNEPVPAPTDTPEGSNACEEGQSQTGSKPPAVKDKQCQYCHQPFTSSSLGRHLDQYLFKKKPDGVHDVEEIRRLRSGITRRTARNSSAKRESPDVGSPATTAAKISDTESKTDHGSRLNGKPGKTGFQVLLNQPTWHATGVINDIPNTTQVSQLRIPAVGVDYAARSSDKTGPETTKALELALREVLDSVKAAVARNESRTNPFDFDLQRQTFPALCLQILPPPPSLFSTHPFPTATSFPLEPPGVDKQDMIKQAMLVQIQQWKSNQLAGVASSAHQTGTSNTSSPPTLCPEMIERSAQQHEEMAIRHVELSFTHWISLPAGARADIWQMEITRAFAREKEKREEVEKKLARTQQEVNQLQAQIERLENCQWPREFAIFPPEMLPIPRTVSRELAQDSKVNSIDSSRWDYDNVVAKWKRVVMHDKSMGRAGSGGVSSIFPDSNSSPHNNNTENNINQNRRGSNNGIVHYSKPHHYDAKYLSSQHNVPSTPDLSASQRFAPDSTQSIPYQTRDPNRTDEPFRPPKRRRTSHTSQFQHSTQQPDEKAHTTNRTLNPPTPAPSSTEYASQQAHASCSTNPTTPSAVAGTISPTLNSKSCPIAPNNDKSYQHSHHVPRKTQIESIDTPVTNPISRICGGSSAEQKFPYTSNNSNSTNEATTNNNNNNNNINNPGNTRNGHSNGLEMLMGACSQQQRQYHQQQQ